MIMLKKKWKKNKMLTMGRRMRMMSKRWMMIMAMMTMLMLLLLLMMMMMVLMTLLRVVVFDCYAFCQQTSLLFMWRELSSC